MMSPVNIRANKRLQTYMNYLNQQSRATAGFVKEASNQQHPTVYLSGE